MSIVVIGNVKMFINRPISIPLYNMPPVELREPMTQIQDLRDKGFIRSIVFLWDSLILFVVNKYDRMRMFIDYRE